MYNTDNRTILHMDLDTFFVSVERLMDRRLKGKPILIGGSSDRGVVASCSYEARRFGVHSAMPMKLARRLCPEALVISGDMEAYSRYSHLVTDIVREEVPVFEKSSIDEFYLDLSGMDRFFGCYKWAGELRNKVIKETGLPISWGLSVNKMVSKIATGEAKPNGQKEIQRGLERDFIAPMPVSKIPMIGEKTGQTLRNMGIDRVQVLREVPLDMLQQMFGKTGSELWRRANAIDDSPVEPYFEQKSLSKERTFGQDTIDMPWLRSVLTLLTEKLCYELREMNKLTSCVSVKLRYSSFDTVSCQERIPYTSCDHKLIEKVLELFQKLYDRRLLVRLVGVRFSGLVQGHYQINMFDDTPEKIHLYQAMDHIKNKYGGSSIIRATGMNVMSERPDINPFGK